MRRISSTSTSTVQPSSTFLKPTMPSNSLPVSSIRCRAARRAARVPVIGREGRLDAVLRAVPPEGFDEVLSVPLCFSFVVLSVSAMLLPLLSHHQPFDEL